MTEPNPTYQLIPGASLTVTAIPAPGTINTVAILTMQNIDKPWYEATRRYGPYNYHPDRCEDWNLESGGNTDLGEPLVAPFSGVILSAHEWGRSTGRVIQLLGAFEYGLIVWAGWHLHEMHVCTGATVSRGQLIGSIGNADGYYAGAHLHEQICMLNEWGVPAPTTFAADGRYDWVMPSRWYQNNGVDAALIARVTAWDGE